MYVVGAASAQVKSTVTELFTELAGARGKSLAVSDVRPLPPGDEGGTSAFFFILICTLAGFVTVNVLGALAPGLRSRQRWAVLAAVAMLAPALTWLILGPLDGALSSSAGGIATTFGLGMLYTAAVVAIGRALQQLIGTLAILPMVVIFFFLNLPSSGGPVQPELLPAFWRFLNEFWGGASGVNAVRDALYFNGNGAEREVAVLAASTFAWLGILALATYGKRVYDHRHRPGSAK